MLKLKKYTKRSSNTLLSLVYFSVKQTLWHYRWCLATKCHVAIKRCRCKLFREIFLFKEMTFHPSLKSMTSFKGYIQFDQILKQNQFSSTIHPKGKSWEQSALSVSPNWKYLEIRLPLNVNYKWKQRRKNDFFVHFTYFLKD